MKMKLKQVLFATAAMALLAIIPAAVRADPVSMVVMNPVVTVSQGGSATLVANITNGGPPTVSLLGITINFTGPSGITFDDAPFFANTPAELAAGESTGFVSFFDVFADLTVPTGLYTGGSFTVSLACDPMGPPCMGSVTGDFEVLVQGAGQVIPEPATMFLLATGLGGAALAKRRARRKGEANNGN